MSVTCSDKKGAFLFGLLLDEVPFAVIPSDLLLKLAYHLSGTIKNSEQLHNHNSREFGTLFKMFFKTEYLIQLNNLQSQDINRAN